MNVYYLSNHVYDGLVGLVSDALDTIDPEDFPTRREFLGRLAELNEILDELQGVIR